MQYTGQILDGQMHGKGNLIYPNGERYEGNWLHGKRHGFGVYHYLDGGRYEGELTQIFSCTPVRIARA